MLKNTLEIFEQDQELLKTSLQKTKNEYRQYDPGWYLYRMLINFRGDKFSNKFIELVYVTLIAWNMNSRGAKLNDYIKFNETIINNKSKIEQLKKYTIKDFENKDNKNIFNLLKEIFEELKLVADGRPILVTLSKTLHFYYPELIVPIDRKYTLNYFFNNKNVPKEINKQFEIFKTIQIEFSRFSNNINFENYKDNSWNASIPKIIDNIIIGFMKIEYEKKLI